MNRIIRSISYVGLSAIASMPMAAFADEPFGLKGLVGQLLSVTNYLVPLLFAIAALVFIMGVITYLYAHDPKKVTDARNYMVFSIISLVVMVIIWALAFLLADSFFPNTKRFYNPTTGQTLNLS